VILVACSPGGEALPQLGLDVDQTSVSGLSAGAYMAGQLQVAHSSHIVGAGIVAGGPFGCAETPGNALMPTAARNATRALEGCMADKLRSSGVPDVTALAQQAKNLAEGGKVDPVNGLSKDRVYLFSGGEDRIVARSVVEAAQRFYTEVGVPEKNIALVTRPDAGHTFLTVDTGNTAEPRRVRLSATVTMTKREPSSSGSMVSLRLQCSMRQANMWFSTSLSSRPVLVTALAAKGSSTSLKHAQKSRLPTAHRLHGCEQNRDDVGKAFIEGSGFARWADANRFVILFPQVSANPLLNPKGCWDWWGYTGEDYLTKDAPQIAAIWKMAERLAERPVTTKEQPRS
jgi:poly(3-hydroxybutyrate) depolymerase